LDKKIISRIIALAIVFSLMKIIFSGYAYHFEEFSLIAAVLLLVFILTFYIVVVDFNEIFQDRMKTTIAILVSLGLGVVLATGFNTYIDSQVCKAECTSIEQDDVGNIYCNSLNELQIAIPVSQKYSECETSDPNECSIKNKIVLLNIKECDSNNKNDSTILGGYIKCKYSFNLKGDGVDRNVTTGKIVKITNRNNLEEIDDTICF